MKTLQHNFTTVEQSKRLLELGVPAWTADGYYVGYGLEQGYSTCFHIHPNQEFLSTIDTIDDLPCWSVGRLIEIMKICNHPDDVDEVFCELAYSKKNLVELIVRLMEENKEITDFSKLE